jgi:predicted dehydrogenase/threonine dehydrogenase-like Zn-dependent dehydrogenase
MRTILEDVRSGEIMVCEVPQPELRRGGILVRTAFSALSAGTDRAHRQQVEKSLIGKALARPDLIRQVVDFARKEGLVAAYQRVQTRLNTLSPLGYSCSGTVIAVADGVQGFHVGDSVACAGVGHANHSEINFVPHNLAARVPSGVCLDAAAITTIGAIAIQGLRQSQATFGETVAVIGAGLVGVLTLQLAKAAGCRVIAIDLDRGRAQRAIEMGADLGLCSTDDNVASTVKEFTHYGVDAAVITAATSSTEPIETAARILRDRGRIVIVGDVGLGVSRHNVYHKELSVVLSRSYGPGRYDAQYEEEGIDYPVGYVRWTEKRNMEAFLGLVASGAVSPAPLLQRRYAVAQGKSGYAELRSSSVYTVLIEYPPAKPSVLVPQSAMVGMARGARNLNRIQVGCIGAGSFASNVIFPALRATKAAVLCSVATASGLASESAKRAFRFTRSQTPNELIHDPGTEAVFVMTRHDSHARFVVAALSHHKPVFVEKPLGITHDQLEEIRCAIEAEKESGYSPFVMVGFNRRFAPLTHELCKFFAERKEPMMVHARINAGYLPPEHWAQHKLDGGRILGELCHFIDWARAVIGAPIEVVSAAALPDVSRYNRDNLAVTMSFADGSLANLLYLANGDKSIPKEYMEVFCQGGVARLHDFCSLELARDGKVRHARSARDKGHNREIQLTIEAMSKETDAPIPITELMEVSRATLAVADSIASGQRIDVRNFLSADTRITI